jgi:hypothetical protein
MKEPTTQLAVQVEVRLTHFYEMSFVKLGCASSGNCIIYSTLYYRQKKVRGGGGSIGY